MVIIEGPANSGKSTLANTLTTQLGIQPASVFKGPHPGDDLMEVVLEDLHAWPERATNLYEGHPLIGEYIYGPIHRNKLPRGFASHAIRPVLRFFWDATLIIYCRPPDDFILGDPGARLYDLMLRCPLITANIIQYDFTQPGQYGFIKSRIKLHDERRTEMYGE